MGVIRADADRDGGDADRIDRIENTPFEIVAACDEGVEAGGFGRGRLQLFRVPPDEVSDSPQKASCRASRRPRLVVNRPGRVRPGLPPGGVSKELSCIDVGSDFFPLSLLGEIGIELVDADFFPPVVIDRSVQQQLPFAFRQSTRIYRAMHRLMMQRFQRASGMRAEQQRRRRENR